jgi:hypothetical protein
VTSTARESATAIEKHINAKDCTDYRMLIGDSPGSVTGATWFVDTFSTGTEWFRKSGGCRPG